MQIGIAPSCEAKTLCVDVGSHSCSGAPSSGTFSPHTPLHLLNSLVSGSLVVSCPSLLLPAGPRLEPPVQCLHCTWWLGISRGLRWGGIFCSPALRHGWYLEGSRKPVPGSLSLLRVQLPGTDALQPLTVSPPAPGVVCGASREQRLGVGQTAGGGGRPPSPSSPATCPPAPPAQGPTWEVGRLPVSLS